MRLIFDLMELMMFNSWVCFKQRIGDPKYDLLKFRVSNFSCRCTYNTCDITLKAAKTHGSSMMTSSDNKQHVQITIAQFSTCKEQQQQLKMRLITNAEIYIDFCFKDFYLSPGHFPKKNIRSNICDIVILFTDT